MLKRKSPLSWGKSVQLEKETCVSSSEIWLVGIADKLKIFRVSLKSSGESNTLIFKGVWILEALTDSL